MTALDQILSFSNPVFASYAFYGVIVVFKMMLMAPYTTLQRFSKKAFANIEDVKRKNEKYVNLNDPDVERVRRNHLNDCENIPLFLFLGFLYVLTNPSPVIAIWHFRVYAVSRILHTFSYQAALQPHRFLTFVAGISVLLSMGFQILRVAF